MRNSDVLAKRSAPIPHSLGGPGAFMPSSKLRARGEPVDRGPFGPNGSLTCHELAPAFPARFLTEMMLVQCNYPCLGRSISQTFDYKMVLASTRSRQATNFLMMTMPHVPFSRTSRKSPLRNEAFRRRPIQKRCTPVAPGTPRPSEP